MLKVVINFNEDQFTSYQHLNIEQDWKQITAIRMYLKARRFNLNLPIFAIKDCKNNNLTFFQNKIHVKKNIIVIHPNPTILTQIVDSLKNQGHDVFAFYKVKDMTNKLIEFKQTNTSIDVIVVPTNLQVSYNLSCKQFLNHIYPKYKVLTLDKNNYRDTINLKNLCKEFKNA
jgi:hypothetical protein